MKATGTNLTLTLVRTGDMVVGVDSEMRAHDVTEIHGQNAQSQDD